MRYCSVFCLFLLGCTTAQIQQTMGDINEIMGSDALTEQEVARGLKEALDKGVLESSSTAGQVNGFLNRPEIRIPFPPDVKKVETRLRQMGFEKEVDRFIESMNRGAEKAAALSVPIFSKAVKEMTIQDAWGILRGPDNAATQYLEDKTSEELFVAFSPVVAQSLEQVNATKYYDDIIGIYNKIPFVEKVDANLEDYVTDRAMDGLFYLIEQEERKIREDPLERTTQLMKKVFRAQDG